MIVVRVAVVMPMTVADAVAMAVQALDLEGCSIELVLRAGDVNVGVGFFGAAKQQACFGSGEVGQDFCAADKGVWQMLKAVGAHDRVHHFGFDSERDVHLVVFGHCFPVLVTQGMAQFETGFDQHVQGLFFQLLEINHHDVTQVQLHHNARARCFIPHQYIAVGQHHVAFQ